MANITAVVTANISNFTKNMGKTKASATDAATSIKRVFAGITAATVALGVAAIKTALRFEELGKRMQVVFGRKEGKKFFDEMSDFAAKSAADTDELVEIASNLAGILGTKETPAFYEAAVFASKQMNKSMFEGGEILGKFFKRLQTGEKIEADALIHLGKIFDQNFIEKVRKGEVTYEEAMKKFKERGVELSAIWGAGLGGEVNKLTGAWKNFLKKLGEGKTLKSVQSLTESLSKLLESIVSSGAADAMANAFMIMAEVMKLMVKNWEIILPMAIAYKAAMIAAASAQAAGAAASGGAGATGAAGKLASKVPGLKAAAVVGTAIGGYKLGKSIGEPIGEALFGPKEGEGFIAGPTKEELAERRAKKMEDMVDRIAANYPKGAPINE